MVSGRDTFTGFQGYTKEDEFANFWRSEQLESIFLDFPERVTQKQSLVKFRGTSEETKSISNSKNFSNNLFNPLISWILNSELDGRVFSHKIYMAKELENFYLTRNTPLI